MNRLRVVFLTPLFILVPVIIGLPDVEAKLMNDTNDFRYYVYVYVVIGSLLNYFFNHYLPFHKYDALRKKQWSVIDYVSKNELKLAIEEYGMTFVIMVPNIKLVANVLPYKADEEKTKIQLFTKILSPIWTSHPGQLNDKFYLTMKQGLCGHAYRRRRNRVSTYSPYQRQSPQQRATIRDAFRLSKKQNEDIGDLKFIASVPIFEKKDEQRRRYDRPIGVLNAESSSPRVKELFAKGNEPLLDELKKQVSQLAAIIGKNFEIN